MPCDCIVNSTNTELRPDGGADAAIHAAARDIGIRRERAANYEQTERGFTECYEAMDAFVSAKRCCASMSTLNDWKRGLEDAEDDT